MANNIDNLKKLEAEAMQLLDKKRALQSSIAESEANIAESTAGTPPAKKEPIKLSDDQIAYFKDLARVKNFTDLTILNEELERSKKMSDALEGSNDQIYLTAYINMLTSHKVDLEKVAAAEKKAQEEAKKNAVNEEIEALRKELLAARVDLDAQQLSLLDKMKKGEKLEGLRAEYSATRARGEEILARINAIDPEISALAAATLDAKKGTKGKKGGELATLVKEKDDLAREYAELDKKMIEVGKAIHAEKGFIPYNEADKEIVKKDRELDRDFEFRKERKEIFEKLNGIKKVESQLAIAAASLAEKYKGFVDKDGNLIKDPKDMSEEEKATAAEYLADKKKLDDDTKQIRAGVAHFENEKNKFMNRFVAERGRGTTKADLEAARKSYMDAYTAHYSKMNGFKKYGINLLKRLGIAKGEVGMPQDIKDKKAAYYKQADSVMEKAIARLRDEGKTEAEVKKISEKYKAIYYNFTQLSAETQKQNAMRVDAFSNDKKFALRKMEEWITGKSKGAALARITLGAVGGVITGGAAGLGRYAIRFGTGMLAGLGLNAGLNKLWQEEKNAEKRLEALNDRLALGKVSLADFDIEYRKIQQKMNASKAIKKAIVTGGAMYAAGHYGNQIADNYYGGPDTTTDGGVGAGNEDGGGAGVGDKDPGTDGPHQDKTIFDTKPTETVVDNGHGWIDAIDEFKGQVQIDHPEWFDVNGNLVDNPDIPADVQEVFSMSTEDFTMEKEYWIPGQENESGFIDKGTELRLNEDGSITYQEPGEPAQSLTKNFSGAHMDSGDGGAGSTDPRPGDKTIDPKFFNQADDSDFGPDKTIDPKFFNDGGSGTEDYGPEKPIDPQFLDDKTDVTNKDVNVSEKSGATNSGVESGTGEDTYTVYKNEADGILADTDSPTKEAFDSMAEKVKPENLPDLAEEVIDTVNDLFGTTTDSNGNLIGGFDSDAWNNIADDNARDVLKGVENASGGYSSTAFDELYSAISTTDVNSKDFNPAFQVDPNPDETFASYLTRATAIVNKWWK